MLQGYFVSVSYILLSATNKITLEKKGGHILNNQYWH